MECRAAAESVQDVDRVFQSDAYVAEGWVVKMSEAEVHCDKIVTRGTGPWEVVGVIQMVRRARPVWSVGFEDDVVRVLATVRAHQEVSMRQLGGKGLLGGPVIKKGLRSARRSKTLRVKFELGRLAVVEASRAPAREVRLVRPTETRESGPPALIESQEVQAEEFG